MMISQYDAEFGDDGTVNLEKHILEANGPVAMATSDEFAPRQVPAFP